MSGAILHFKKVLRNTYDVTSHVQNIIIAENID